jgi:hypothetical protein
MNGIVVRMQGSKLIVEVDILKAIAEGVGGGRPISTRQARPQAQELQPVGVIGEPRDALVVFRTARASTFGYSSLPAGTSHGHAGGFERFRGHRR